jgi:hypothetical protein
MNNNNEYYGFSLNKSNNHTPNRNDNKTTSPLGTPIEYNNIKFPNELESNGKVDLNKISDDDKLLKRFNEKECSIREYCTHYLSLFDVFNSVDKETKNKLIDYLNRFNSRCQEILNVKTNNLINIKKNEESIKEIKENCNKLKKENNNLIEKFRIEKQELIINYKKKIEELNNIIKERNKEINSYKNKISDKEKEIEKKDQEILNIKEENMNLVPGSSDNINISYGLDEHIYNIEIDIPTQKEFKNFSDGFKKTEEDFNKYARELVYTSNNTLDKFKELYFKIKGKDWLDSNNSLNNVYFSKTYNINQKFSWSNIINNLFTLQSIINQIFELVNPTQKCDPKKLNEDSCEFLLNYIVGLRKLFFVQKNILENTFNMGDTYAEKIKNFESFKKVTEEAEKFFSENNHILNNQSYFGRFKDELKEENVKDLSVEEYIKNIKSVLVQAKNISEKSENEYNEYIKNLELQNNRTTTENIEIELSNTKSKRINTDNGI